MVFGIRKESEIDIHMLLRRRLMTEWSHALGSSPPRNISAAATDTAVTLPMSAHLVTSCSKVPTDT
jgi:hypothetical protein